MDLLKREMERKKKAMVQAKAAAAAAAAVIPVSEDEDRNTNGDSSGRNSKRTFLRATDLRKYQDEEEAKLRKRRRHEETETTAITKAESNNESQEPSANHNNNNKNNEIVESQKHHNKVKEEGSKDDAKKISRKIKKDKESSLSDTRKTWTPAEVSKRLRDLGLPIRLFGERTIVRRSSDVDDEDQTSSDKAECDDSQRVERLQQAMTVRKDALSGLTELDEFRLGSGHGIRNTFLEKDIGKEDSAISVAAVAASAASNDGKSAAGNKHSKPTTNQEDGVNQDDAQAQQDATDPHKRIYKYFKGLLKEWEQELAQRPESVARSLAGKNDTKTLKQCKDYIRPLFKLCKNRQLESGLMSHIVKIVEFCQQGEFVRAHDAYMDVAIGRAAWPIGVTMVGIHARSGRAKIESANVAHVMNSELQRKYLTSVKRLMSYAQKKRDDVDPSKKVLS
jgi:pre-mRNA-splicing factor 18